ncbi:MAG: hypothetical protein KGZ58_12525 [Ignavibacteriales bacterium]|nr:hypothetical protein [Ignavibacteriales bacterium]
MEFVLWASKSCHLFGIILLCGSYLFQSGILYPVAKVEGEEKSKLVLHLEKRFIPFIWLSLWMILLTGILLALLSPKFEWFLFSTTWQILLAFKELTFVFIFFFSIGYIRMFRLLEKVIAANERDDFAVDVLFEKMKKFRTLNVYLSIIAMLLAAGMR